MREFEDIVIVHVMDLSATAIAARRLLVEVGASLRTGTRGRPEDHGRRPARLWVNGDVECERTQFSHLYGIPRQETCDVARHGARIDRRRTARR